MFIPSPSLFSSMNMIQFTTMKHRNTGNNSNPNMNLPWKLGVADKPAPKPESIKPNKQTLPFILASLLLPLTFGCPVGSLQSTANSRLHLLLFQHLIRQHSLQFGILLVLLSVPQPIQPSQIRIAITSYVFMDVIMAYRATFIGAPACFSSESGATNTTHHP